MSEPAPAPFSAFHGVLAVWIASLVAAVVLGFVVPEGDRVSWLTIAFGVIVLGAFAVQLRFGRVQGFIVRVSASIIGALVVMGAVSAIFGLAAIASRI